MDTRNVLELRALDHAFERRPLGDAPRAVGLTAEGRAQTWVFVAVLFAAAVVRLAGLGHDSLSHDEAWRANYSFDGGLGEARRFPPLQYLLGWTIQHAIGRSEWLLRLPYALAGVAVIFVLYRFARSRLSPWAGVYIAAVAAFHPVLVTHSRLFKVFSFEALMAALMIGAGLHACREPSARWLWRFALIGLIGLGFTFTTSLLLVAWFVPILWAFHGWRRRTLQTWHGFLAVWLTLLVAGIGWYVWVAGATSREDVTVSFELVERAWPASFEPGMLLQWAVSSSYAAMLYVLGISSVWPPLNWCIGAFELLAVAAALGELGRRCRPLFAVSAILLAELLVAGALQWWPFGGYRTMTFLVPIAAVVVGCGLCELVRCLGRSPASWLLIAVCVVVPLARATKATLVDPPVREHIRPVVEYIESKRQPGDAVFVYYAVDDAFKFYRPRGEIPIFIQPRSDRGRFDLFSQRFAEWIDRHNRVWFIFTHDYGHERIDWTGHLKSTYQLLDQFAIGDASAHLFAR